LKIIFSDPSLNDTQKNDPEIKEMDKGKLRVPPPQGDKPDLVRLENRFKEFLNQ
jgi:hypothetical protein